MVNENYEQVARNAHRGTYLKGKNASKLNDTEANNGNLPDGPVLRDTKKK
jgi:hypothetical protein